MLLGRQKNGALAEHLWDGRQVYAAILVSDIAVVQLDPLGSGESSNGLRQISAIYVILP